MIDEQDGPNVVTEAAIEDMNIRVRFVAFRTLTPQEVRQSVAMFLRSKAGKKIRPNTTYEIVTVHGALGD